MRRLFLLFLVAFFFMSSLTRSQFFSLTQSLLLLFLQMFFSSFVSMSAERCDQVFSLLCAARIFKYFNDNQILVSLFYFSQISLRALVFFLLATVGISWTFYFSLDSFPVQLSFHHIICFCI